MREGPLRSLAVSGLLLLATIIVEAAQYPLVHAIDQEVLRHVAVGTGMPLLEAIAFTGSIEFTVIIALTVLVWEYYRVRNIGPETMGLWAGLALSMTLVFLLKLGLATPRPAAGGYVSPAEGLIGRADQYAFPSGHTARASTIASYYTGKWGTLTTLALWLWATGVATARILQGVHWPSDVIAGLLVGWFSGSFGRALSSLAERARYERVLEES